MRCRIHPTDPGAGVCACCLRERLSNLFADPQHNDATSSTAIQKTPELSAPPAIICSRSKSHGTSAADCSGGNRKSSTNKSKSDSIIPKSSVSNSWHLALILWQRKKDKKKSTPILPDVEETTRGRLKKPHLPAVNGRGLSPASTEEEDGRRLSTDSPLRRKAQRQQSPRKLSSYALCMNPLVRPNQRNHGSETEFAGELRGTLNRRCSGVGAGAPVPNISSGLVPNRSRKLVDLGKVRL